MPRLLKVYIAGVVALGAFALVAATLVIPVDPQIAITFGELGAARPRPTQGEILAGIAFWIAINLVAARFRSRSLTALRLTSATPRRLRRCSSADQRSADGSRCSGTTEVRELRGEVPWYGILTNHACIVIPAIVAGVVFEALPFADAGFLAFLGQAMIAGAVFYGINCSCVGILVSLRSGSSVRSVLRADLAATAAPSLALAPLGLADGGRLCRRSGG